MEYIAIFGAPRSGTSWLGQLFNSSPQVVYRFQPLFSYSFKGRLSEQASSKAIQQFYDDLLVTEDDFVLQTKNTSGKVEEVNFNKEKVSHLVWKEVRYHYIIEALLKNSNTKIIGIVRHPCAVIHSWLNAPKEFKSEWNPLEEWRFAKHKNENKKEEYNGYEKWKELAFIYKELSQKYSDQFHIIAYEDLNLHTSGKMKELYEFCNLPWQKQTQRFIEASKTHHNNDAYSVFRNQKQNDEWKDRFPKKIENAIKNDPDFILLNEYYQWNI